MKRFADLLDRLAYEPRRNAKLALLKDYFATAPDPDRGYALAAMTDALSFANLKPALIRQLILERVDPVLFGLSYDYVGDLSETVALLWRRDARINETPTLAAAVEAFANASKSDAPALTARFLDALDETGRWALLKLVTGALRIGVSARLAKTALAQIGDPVREPTRGLYTQTAERSAPVPWMRDVAPPHLPPRNPPCRCGRKCHPSEETELLVEGEGLVGEVRE